MLIDQPLIAKQMIQHGWRFAWESENSLVVAHHVEGGKQSVVEVYPRGRTIQEQNELGEAIAKLLNGK